MRYFFALMAAIVMVALGVILLGGGRDGGNKLPKTPPVTLPDYANTNAVVRFTYDGIINGDNTHSAIRISVSRDQRLLDILQGYSGNVISSTSETNTADAYQVFLNALNNSGFTKIRKTKNTNELGACPLGNRFNYELYDTGSVETEQNTWSATCGGMGTFGGNRTTVMTLFQRQITNYNQLTQNVDLR